MNSERCLKCRPIEYLTYPERVEPRIINCPEITGVDHGSIFNPRDQKEITVQFDLFDSQGEALYKPLTLRPDRIESSHFWRLGNQILPSPPRAQFDGFTIPPPNIKIRQIDHLSVMIIAEGPCHFHYMDLAILRVTKYKYRMPEWMIYNKIHTNSCVIKFLSHEMEIGVPINIFFIVRIGIKSENEIKSCYSKPKMITVTANGLD